jgi:hypothetical protein
MLGVSPFLVDPMAPSTQIVLSGCLTFGVPILFALRELLTLRRGSGGSWRPDPHPAPAPRPTMPPTGASPYAKPLPACLIPVRQPEPQNTRVLEPA